MLRRTSRWSAVLIAALSLIGCGDSTGDEEVGDAATDESTSSVESSETSTSSTDTDTTRSTDTDSTSSTDTTATTATTETTDATDSTDTTTGADPSCEDDLYSGVGLADDGWGVGDLCDEIWVCAAGDQVPLILAAVPGAVCGPGQGCPDSRCTISYQTIVDAQVLASVCEALLLPGIDEAFCLVLGP